ncbi:MAG: CoA transferase [Deltaproteobacteria bacterium]|nr:CoA transferase [Deltaproteobacteria bacterium]
MLSGYRVLDLTDERGFLAGRVLADLGADVVKIEPPGGDAERRRGPFVAGIEAPERSLPWLAANPGKRSMLLDLAASDADRDTFRQLVASADVVLESFAPGTMEGWGIGRSALEAGLPDEHPGLVYCAITPFGQHGPYAGRSAHDLICVAMGGNAFMTGDPARPPLRSSLPTAYMHAGPEAVVGILLALYARRDLGRGQGVDVSAHECQLATLITGAGQYALTGRLGQRSGYRTGRTREIWRCKDGFVSYGLRGGPARVGSLVASVEYMAESAMAPAWLQEMDWASYSPLTLSDDELDRLEEVFAAFFASKSMRELYEQALARSILLAPCNNAREILEQPQLRSRDLFVRVEPPGLDAVLEYPGFFARSSRCEIGLRGPAPRPGEHDAELRAELAGQPRRPSEPVPDDRIRLATHVGERGVLEGLKVLELGSGAAGPVATRYLVEQGAHVIRIESAKRPDFLRIMHVTKDNRDEPDIFERAPMFALLNPDKQSLAINMKQPEGRALVLRLIDEWADVVTENFAPGVMERWGLDYPVLGARRPDLVMVSGCLFGQTGPQRSYPGFGGQGAAIAGFNHMTGWPGQEALGPYATITDSLAPRFVASALLAALLHLRRTGEGQAIDVSQIETAVYSLAEMIVRCSASGEVMERMGNRSEIAAPHGIYPCRPDAEAGRERFIAIAALDDSQWRALCQVFETREWVADERFESLEARLAHVDELDASVAEQTAAHPAEALVQALQAVGVEAGLVCDFAQLVDDPQLAARGHFTPLPHESLGELLYERSGFRLSDTPGGLRAAGPRLGEHTREILSTILGLDAAEIDRLEAEEITV